MAGYAFSIIEKLKFGMEDNFNFPYDRGEKYRRKPTKPHMKDIALIKNQIFPLGDGSYFFDIGNENAEAKAPQYHILENARVIMRPNKGTKKTKGSQADIKDKSKRDYNAYSWKARTQTKSELFGSVELLQEYRQNMNGNFFRRDGTTKAFLDRTTKNKIHNRKHRENEHWQYIEKILALIVPKIATSINATLIVSEGTYDNEYINKLLPDNYTFAKQDSSIFTQDYDNSPIYDT
jgi:hypothetical protein